MSMANVYFEHFIHSVYRKLLIRLNCAPSVVAFVGCFKICFVVCFIFTL